ncbi:MAG: aminodeoxychorismate/anthranilate synthase component II, partial [Marinicaulis sp.]|nr:aminodeoxychorismate/anthranilate synthase component II [Marinicaulis sp.]
MIKTLLIDNYDSFSHMLADLFSVANGTDVTVLKNDELNWAEIEKLDYDNIVISPGPGRPERAADFGVCRDAIVYSTKPLLGVCLGHQGIAQLIGHDIVRAAAPM